MSQGDASLESGTDLTASEKRRKWYARQRTTGGEYSFFVRGVESGAFAIAGAAVSLVGGIRALRGGDRLQGVGRLLLAGLFTVMAVTQRWPDAGTGTRRARKSGEEASAEPAVDRIPVAEAEPDEPTGDADAPTDAAATVETSTGEEAETATEIETVDDESYDRLGSAAIDGQSLRVPVPQRAFNQGFLAQGANANWGVREHDDAVLVSQLFDPIQDATDVRYVGSTEVGVDSRLLRVPDAVLDHWDSVAGGGTAVSGGDDLVFLTSGGLAERQQVRVVPDAWVDDILERGE